MCTKTHAYTTDTYTEYEDGERSGLCPGGFFLSRVHLGWDVSRAGAMQEVEDCSRGPGEEATAGKEQQRTRWSLHLLGFRKG